MRQDTMARTRRTGRPAFEPRAARSVCRRRELATAHFFFRAAMLKGVLVPGARLRARLSMALVLLAKAASSEPSRVALVSPTQPDPLIAEVTSRMNAELTASGFEVVIVPSSTDGDLRAVVELAKTEPGVVATFAVVSLGKQAAVDVWLSDRITGKTIVKRLDAGPVPAARGPAVLAIRAVEPLRASLLQTL